MNEQVTDQTEEKQPKPPTAAQFLRGKGFIIRVQHWRRHGKKLVPMHWSKVQSTLLDMRPNAKGGQTKVTVLEPTGHWSMGLSKCNSKLDQFDKTAGLNTALWRALIELAPAVNDEANRLTISEAMHMVDEKYRLTL